MATCSQLVATILYKADLEFYLHELPDLEAEFFWRAEIYLTKLYFMEGSSMAL